MPAAKLPRLITGIPLVDSWIETLCAAIDRANNVTAAPPVLLKASPDGIHLTASFGVFAHAKSGGGGVPAMSGTTYGHADVTLYSDNGTSLATQAVTVRAHNKSLTAVGANKHLILVRFDSKWWVLWEDCT